MFDFVCPVQGLARVDPVHLCSGALGLALTSRVGVVVRNKDSGFRRPWSQSEVDLNFFPFSDPVRPDRSADPHALPRRPIGAAAESGRGRKSRRIGHPRARISATTDAGASNSCPNSAKSPAEPCGLGLPIGSCVLVAVYGELCNNNHRRISTWERRTRQLQCPVADPIRSGCPQIEMGLWG